MKKNVSYIYAGHTGVAADCNMNNLSLEFRFSTAATIADVKTRDWNVKKRKTRSKQELIAAKIARVDLVTHNLVTKDVQTKLRW